MTRCYRIVIFSMGVPHCASKEEGRFSEVLRGLSEAQQSHYS